ncbi:MAG: DUF6491 family protein [Hyphomonadaceae bacterium]
MIRTLVVAGALALTAGCATPQQSASAARDGRDCFNANSISGFGVIDARTVRVDVGPSRQYALTLFSNARELRFNERIGIETRPSDWVCAGSGVPGVTIYSLDHPGQRSWPVTAVARLPDEQRPG